MNPEEVEAVARQAARAAVREIMADQAEQSKDLVSDSVRATLTQLGIDHKDPLEMQKDFQHLRTWRKAGEDLRSKSLITLVGLFLAALGTITVLGFRAWMKQP